MSIVFSIRALVVEGQLAGVRAGDPREAVHARLGPPDEQVASTSEESEIWRYGNFEISFEDEVVYQLRHHALGDLEAGPGRELEAWILGGPAAPDRDAVVARLVAEEVPFVTGHGWDHRRILQVRGGARLLFDRDENTGGELWRAIETSAHARGFTPDLAPPTGPTLDRFLLIRRMSAYTSAHVLLGVFTTASLADAARAAYLARYTADPASDPWHEQAYKDDGLVAKDLEVRCFSGPAEATEVVVVSDYSEGFGQIVRRFDSLHESMAAAEVRIAALNDVEDIFPHYALPQLARLDALLSDAEKDQPDYRDYSDSEEPET
ncbi:hypothetical protein OV203_07740 [Nannocystis sp. ILAH1]|uniref:hypothetical protein n=1 Tax=Nannocystis sp. ILAH1 TaxID=2996789 RepID=UPI00227227AB|nr:hypothetical protein [Nannocystis sp. ILAH1]MCY0987009.1 hypothetical protein [Nannocystis sp. ILAH1]